MKMSVKHLVAAASAAAVVASFACSTSSGASSGGVDCSNPARCPNDPAPSQNAVDACTKALSGTCASQYKTQSDCINANIKCGADGKLDANATNGACQSQESAYSSCESAVAMDAGLTPKEAGGD
jgi:hypothetical protein